MLVLLWMLVFSVLLFVLVSGTVLDLLFYYRTRDAYHLKRIAVFWSAPLVFIGATIFLIWWLSPAAVTKDSIVGCYEVDDRFYPGPNARWQKQLFRFEVGTDNSFVLYERLADGTDKPFFGHVSWANDSPEKWSIRMRTPHPVAVKYPLLYRQQHGFYYVFRTKAFGNMFFRRMGDSCEVKLAERPRIPLFGQPL